MNRLPVSSTDNSGVEVDDKLKKVPDKWAEKKKQLEKFSD